MKIIHQNGFSDKERADYRHIIYKNLTESAQSIVLAMRKLGLVPEEPTNRDNADKIMDFDLELISPVSSYCYSEDLAMAIQHLWQDPIIPKLLEHSSEFYLMDSAPYFFKEAHRIGKLNYVPTETDILRSRQKTAAIVETHFAMGPLLIHMFDVGGQRSERKKWIHCFEGVTSIIFCTAISEYDQVLLEEKNQNRMTESLALFESIVNSRWFLRTSIILFMNKIDVFRNKIPKIPLERYCPEYLGGPDVNKAAKFILLKFMQANRARLNVYPHLTQATDTTNIRLVFAAVKETIMQNALKASGIL